MGEEKYLVIFENIEIDLNIILFGYLIMCGILWEYIFININIYVGG